MSNDNGAMAIVSKAWNTGVWMDALHKVMPNREVRSYPMAEKHADEICYALAWQPPIGALASFRNLKVIFSLGAGVDHILRDEELPDIPVVRVVEPDMTMRMSEYVIQQVLMHHRQQLLLSRRQAKAEWVDLQQWAASAVRVGIMGLGVLGQDAAQKLAMIGFEVAGWSQNRKQLPNVTCYAGADELDGFLGRTDILVCLLPHTPQTEGILNRKLFCKLARDGRLGGPVIINAGRGKLQIESDILASLDAGELIGASLDVFEQEPLAGNSKLWRQPNIYISPHSAADSDPLVISKNVAEQIAAYEKTQSLQNVIDREKGY